MTDLRKSLSDLPAVVPQGAREVAILTAWAAVLKEAEAPVREAIKEAAAATEWQRGFLVSDRTQFDVRTAPFRRYEGFADFFDRELRKSWRDWRTIFSSFGIDAGRVGAPSEPSALGDRWMQWGNNAVLGGCEILRPCSEALHLPGEFEGRSRHVALLTTWHAAMDRSLKPVLDALCALSRVVDWSHEYLVAESLDWRSWPLRRYESAEDFWERELADVWQRWAEVMRLPDVYGIDVMAPIVEVEAPPPPPEPPVKSRRRHSREIFKPRPIEPMQRLADLREAIIKRSDKRLPKWKFLLGPDLIVQMQPKPDAQRRFDCVALACENVSPAMFSVAHDKLPLGWVRIAFTIEVVNDMWSARMTRWARSRTAPRDAERAVWDKALAGLPQLREVSARVMALPHCLICGRALIDSVSMARLIGPECAGTSSESLPFTYDASAPPVSSTLLL